MQLSPKALAYLLLWTIVFSCPPLAIAAPQRLALVIGNSNYQNLNDLPNPGNDAKAVAEKLEALGFTLVGRDGKPAHGVVLDLDEHGFSVALRQFSQVAKGAEIALFYYAGHGMQLEGEPYLLPVDVPADDLELTRRDAIELEAEVLQRLDGKAKLTLAVFDACREIPELQGAVTRATRGRGAGAFRGLARVPSIGRSRIVAYSGAAGQLVKDGDGRHSPYTAALLAQLDRPGLEVGDLFRQVAYEVGQSQGGQQPIVVIDGVPPQHYYFLSPVAGSPPTSPPGPPVAPAGVSNPPLDHDPIQALLKTCAKHLNANRWTMGAEGNAVDCYHEVLERAPDNHQARAGLAKIAHRYGVLARKALDAGQWDQARKRLQRLAKASPGDPIIEQLERELEVLEAESSMAEEVEFAEAPEPRTEPVGFRFPKWVRLRSSPEQLNWFQVEAMLRGWGLFDATRNKEGRFPHDLVDNQDGTVTDRTTKLMWQKAGAFEPMDYDHTAAYITRLNQEYFSGHTDWRLPTLEEAASLLDSAKYYGLHTAPVFEARQSWIWTADRKGDNSAWNINFRSGIVNWNEFGNKRFVRACRAVE